jgi:hypothetical protein
MSPAAGKLVGSDDSDECQTPSEMPTTSVGMMSNEFDPTRKI